MRASRGAADNWALCTSHSGNFRARPLKGIAWPLRCAARRACGAWSMQLRCAALRACGSMEAGVTLSTRWTGSVAAAAKAAAATTAESAREKLMLAGAV